MKKKFIFCSLFLLLIMPVVSIFINNYSKVSADGQYTVSYKSVDGQIAGTFQFIDTFVEKKFGNGSYPNYNIDVNGGIQESNNVEIICYPQNFGSNQQFKVSCLEVLNNEYVYSISPMYSSGYVFDVDYGRIDDGTKIQLFQRNATAAQKFKFKEVYVIHNGTEKFLGYVILTGSSNYKKALKRENGKILQYELPESYSPEFYWDMQQVFDPYLYTSSGYKYFDSQQGVYNESLWAKTSRFDEFSNLFIITNNNLNNSPRITYDSKYAYLGSASLKITQNNVINYYNYILNDKKKFSENLNADYCKYDESTIIDQKYPIEGGMGRGLLQIIYTDSIGQTFSYTERDILVKHDYYKSGTFNYQGQSFNSNAIFDYDINFDKVGDYTIKLYYKLDSNNVVKYLCKEYSFSIIPENYDCEALFKEENEEDEQPLANYTFTVDNANEIQVSYSGNQEKQANKETLINYVSGAYLVTESNEKQTAIEDFKTLIKTFNKFQIAFANKAFYLDAYANKYVTIQETAQGYSSSVNNMATQTTNAKSTDGIYTYISQNLYSYDKAFYRVYMQSVPTSQVFRNATYVYANEAKQLINYASDYAFIEIIEEFPYTLITDVSYEFTNENLEVISSKYNYKSKEIIYNTDNSPRYLKFTVLDIAGNSSVMYLCILPSQKPHVNYDNFSNWSLKYNYLMQGYAIVLYNDTNKNYETYIYSSFDVARENVFKNIFENEEICKLKEDNTYEVNFKTFSDETIVFNSNEELVNWIYNKCDEQIKFTTITPEDYGNYIFDELAMHTGTIYLQKDYYFTSDQYFPLFESYKIKFEYYSSENNNLIKSGYITYNGDYKYGQSLFEILAENKEENWVDGYVEFTEYNISANAGLKYVGYIIVNNPSTRIRLQEGNSVKFININDDAELKCESFAFTKLYDTTASISVKFNDTTININTAELNNYKFNEPGEYEIRVLNTHGLEFNLKITVSNLNKYFNDVNNFGFTNNVVEFTPENLNFECYINGERANDISYTSIENGYRILFEPKDISQDIVIYKDNKVFCFKILGNYNPDLTIYTIYNEYNCSINDVKLIYSSLLSNYIELEENIKIVNDILASNTNYSVAYAAAESSIEDDFITNKNKFLSLKATMQDLNKFLDKINSIDNPLFKKNENFIKVNEFKNLMADLDRFYEDEELLFINLATTFYNSLGIKNVTTNLINELIDFDSNALNKTLQEYYEFVDSHFDNYNKLFEGINSNIFQAYEKINNYVKSAEIIDCYNSGYYKCEAIIEILNNLNQEKEKIQLLAANTLRRFKNVNIEFNNPIYLANEYVILKQNYAETEQNIKNLKNFDFAGTNKKIEALILNVFNSAFESNHKAIVEQTNYLNNAYATYQEIANRDIPFCPYSAIKKAIEKNKAEKEVKNGLNSLINCINNVEEEIKSMQKLEKALKNYSCYENVTCIINVLNQEIKLAESSIAKAKNI